MRSLSAIHLAGTLAKLPAPLAVYRSPQARFELYRAKDLYSARWNSPALHELVAICRTSYSRYGKRPLLDAYDGKAAIYLARAVYQAKKSARHEEWLSIRMVPGDKKPIGVSEPEIFQSLGKRIDHWMKKKIGARHFWNRVASSSRMCGIHPYVLEENGKISFSGDEGHKFTPLCFALIHKQFGIDYPLSRFPYRYITAMVRPDFYKKGLAYTSSGRSVRPVHTPAHRFLGIDRKTLHVDREVYSYPFPLYWLDKGKLLRLVNNLRKKQHKASLPALKAPMFSHLVDKTTHPVSIAGIRIKPQEMRGLIDRFVPDVPELKITPATRWYHGMDTVLKAAKIKLQPKTDKI